MGLECGKIDTRVPKAFGNENRWDKSDASLGLAACCPIRIGARLLSIAQIWQKLVFEEIVVIIKEVGRKQ